MGIEQIWNPKSYQERLHQLIGNPRQVQDIIIVALWDNRAVVTKAVQQLYHPSQFPSIQD